MAALQYTKFITPTALKFSSRAHEIQGYHVAAGATRGTHDTVKIQIPPLIQYVGEINISASILFRQSVEGY